MECNRKRCRREAYLNYRSCEQCRGSDKKLKQKLKESGLCIMSCGRDLVTKNHCRECADKNSKRGSIIYKAHLVVVYSHYGNQCACCGLADTRFLSIDHINNDGYLDRGNNKERRSGSQVIKKIIRDKFPDDLQLLCFNCNMGKSRNKGVCPHKEDTLYEFC